MTPEEFTKVEQDLQAALNNLLGTPEPTPAVGDQNTGVTSEGTDETNETTTNTEVEGTDTTGDPTTTTEGEDTGATDDSEDGKDQPLQRKRDVDTEDD